MYHYAAVFFVIALVAAMFGFGPVAPTAAMLGKGVFVAFFFVAVLLLLAGLVRRR